MGPELQAAITAHRLGQQGAPMPPDGAPQPQPQAPMGDPSMGSQPQMTPAGGLTPEAENQIILQALTAKLKSNSKIQEAQLIPPKPMIGG